MGPLAAKTSPGEEWKVGPHRATFEPDYGRRGKLWVHKQDYHLVKAERLPENNPNNPKYRAFIALWKYKQDIMRVIGACAAVGLAYTLASS